MDVSRFLNQEGSEKFAEAVKLNDVDSQSDPETDPFKSKYKAREIWESLKTTIESNWENEPSGSGHTFLLGTLNFKIGTNYFETEELSSGQEHLDKCVDILTPVRLDDKACNTLHIAYNQLGILYSTRRQPSLALENLQKAETLYSDYKREVGSSPYQTDELFDKTEEDEGQKVQKRHENFENCYTLTLYYMAQVYAKLDENSLSAKYCHVTLRRQLETKKYDAMDWSLNAATLSQFYITSGDRTLSRHCLASAQRILLELGEPNMTVTINESDSQGDVDRKEKLPRSWADLYRCWIKYCLSLLEDSMTDLLEKVRNDEDSEDTADHNTDKKEGESNADKNEGESTSQKEETETSSPATANHNDETEEGASNTPPDENNIEKKNKDALFFDLELTSIEDKITDKFVLEFESAKVVFLQGLKWLNEAKQFYLLDGHCSDHVELIQDNSKLFKLLAFFEMDFERQCKMHKRRVDMLQDILKELSQQHYLLVCRQLIYEIAETYSAMLDIKLAIIEDSGVAPNQHAVKKINTLTQQSISMFERYVDTLRDTTKKLPDKLAAEDERPLLIAYFCMGRLHGKFLEFELGKRLENMKRSLDCYKVLVDYCDRNASGKEKAITEYEICSEMVTLMPYKMQKLTQQLS